jgi:hypothetical protein
MRDTMRCTERRKQTREKRRDAGKKEIETPMDGHNWGSVTTSNADNETHSHAILPAEMRPSLCRVRPLDRQL